MNENPPAVQIENSQNSSESVPPKIPQESSTIQGETDQRNDMAKLNDQTPENDDIQKNNKKSMMEENDKTEDKELIFEKETETEAMANTNESKMDMESGAPDTDTSAVVRPVKELRKGLRTNSPRPPDRSECRICGLKLGQVQYFNF